MSIYKAFNMNTVINTTNRSLNDNKELIVHNFGFFKEVMISLTNTQVSSAFKGMNATVIVVKDKAIAVRAHMDNPKADIYVLSRNTQCVTLAFKGTEGISTITETTEEYVLCSSEMINWK